MKIFNFLSRILRKMQADLSTLFLEGGAQCTVYLEEQENIPKYPCIILKMQTLKPQTTTLPSYEFSFSINLISQSQLFAILLPSKIVHIIGPNNFIPENAEEPSCKEIQYKYKVTFLEHVSTNWDTAEDRFSVRTQMQYQGLITLDRK